MQASLFDEAPEPVSPAPVVSDEDDFDIFADLPEPFESAPEPQRDESLMAWCRRYNYHLSLGEVVLRAKTIEANCLNGLGPEAEMQYLLDVYKDDLPALRAQILEVARILKAHCMQPGMGKNTEETSL